MPALLYEMARDQHGVLSRKQALEAGLSRSGLQRRIRAGLLERVGVSCVRLPGHPETWRQQLHVGLLDLDGALVAGRAAGALLGLDGFEEGPLEYLVPRSIRRRTTNGEVRSVASIPLIDRVVVDEFACTSAARTLIDSAPNLTRRQLENGIDSAIRLGLTSEKFLRHRLADLRHCGRAGVRHLDRALDGAGGHSALERAFLVLVRGAGLPVPTCQQIHRDGQRFVARTDFSWEPQRTIAEVNGHATHASRQQRARDAQRQAELGLLGWLVLTFTYEQVMYEPAAVVGVLRRALQAPTAPIGG